MKRVSPDSDEGGQSAAGKWVQVADQVLSAQSGKIGRCEQPRTLIVAKPPRLRSRLRALSVDRWYAFRG